MVAENVEAHFLVLFQRDIHEPLDAAFVATQLRRDGRRQVSFLVEHAVEVRPINESKIDFGGVYVGDYRFEIVRFALGGVADVVRNSGALEEVEDIGAAIHATRLQRIFLFGEVEQRNVPERNVVEIEVATELQLGFDEFRKPPANTSPARNSFRQPAQSFQGSEGRMRWVVNEVTPIPMVHRPVSGDDGGHAG